MSNHYVLFLAAVFLAAFGQVALKKGASRQEISLWKQYVNPWVIGGYFLFVLSLGTNSIAYRGVPLKNGPMLESLGFILVPLLSKLFFNERITPSRFCGFMLILVGVVMFSV